ncbi:CRISPR-associated endoribonuclease Cas6 [uncultured Clostridium sp.]|uniref:CRISPR-associated endoribonuclease Cas6 n=1 Tax=uncultured Clostridium sp. TaxID=59620 RepID=UPI0025F9738D|nr:CRISPR-associated endoribonuclease Cas6 [uncultured Clostridium sp.]
MRIRIVGKAKDGVIPIGYRIMIVSLLKNAIEKGDKEYFDKLYYYNDKKNKKIKSFCFGTYLEDFKFEGDIIRVNGKMNITISTPDYILGIAIYNGLLKLGTYKFKDKYEFIREKVILEKEKWITTENIVLKTLSPIVIKNSEGKPVDIANPDYSKELNYICNLMLNSYRGYGLRKNLIFNPVTMKKNVIKEEITGFSNNSKKKFIYINGYSGTFVLEGDIEDLNLLLQLGIGFRRSEGFGLISLV